MYHGKGSVLHWWGLWDTLVFVLDVTCQRRSNNPQIYQRRRKEIYPGESKTADEQYWIEKSTVFENFINPNCLGFDVYRFLYLVWDLYDINRGAKFYCKRSRQGYFRGV